MNITFYRRRVIYIRIMPYQYLKLNRLGCIPKQKRPIAFISGNPAFVIFKNHGHIFPYGHPLVIFLLLFYVCLPCPEKKSMKVITSS